MTSPKTRIFIGLVEIAGYYHNLSEGLRALGQEVTFFTLSDHPFSYADSKGLWWLPHFIRFCYKRFKAKKNILFRLFWAGLEYCALLLYFVWAAAKHDIFLFGFGTSFLPFQIDYLILRALRKKVVANLAHGSETRPPYVGVDLQVVESSPDSEKKQILFLKNSVQSKANMVKRVEKFSDYLIGAPYSTSQFAARPFINWFALGVPGQFEVKQNNHNNSGAVRILHSPSKPKAKGTARIRQAIDNIRAKGHPVEFVEIIGMAHSEVLRELSQCSFVIDQLYSDTPMAGFATEAAWFSKPAVVGGYGLEDLPLFFPKDVPFPPSQICHPDDLENAILKLVTDPVYREKLGKAANQFVRTYWTRDQVAQRYIRIFNDDVPLEWRLDPKQVVYLQGCGVSEELSKKWVGKLISTYGISSLALRHRPDLERAFLDFAGID